MSLLRLGARWLAMAAGLKDDGAKAAGRQRRLSPEWPRWRPHSAWALPVARPQFWVVVAMIAVGTILHYGDWLPLLSTAAAHSPVPLAIRQSLERILFLVPVLYATVAFRAWGGGMTLLAAGAVLLPRAVMSLGTVDQALPQTAGVALVGGLLIVTITALRREIETQRQLHESLNFYARQVLTAQENERKRIALELHDGAAQSLLLICQRLDRLAAEGSRRLAAEVVGELRELRGVAVQTLTDLRRLTQDLRPRILDDLGLLPALEWLADTLACQYGFQATVAVDGALPKLSPDVELLLFRIAQEALHNVGRHAGASEARLSLNGGADRVRMTVADNGQGFQLPKRLGDLGAHGKLGLLGMYERARLLSGTLNIHSELAKGTQIVVELPLNGVSPSASDVSSSP